MPSSLEAVRDKALSCTACPLHQSRTQVVFGRGNPMARILLVGEAPGRDEDLQGAPFVGSAGQLLDKILAAVGLGEEDVYISNTVLCRPPGNRVPEPSEVEACRRHREAIEAAIDPVLVVLLGATAAKAVLGRGTSITRVRGQRFESSGRLYYPTFHPAALLRDPSKKLPVWHDFQRIVRDYREMIGGAFAGDGEVEPWPAAGAEESR